jgi:hypothetical protein
MEQRYIEFIQDVLITIHANIHELEERKGFREMIAILKVSADEFNLPKEEIGF